MQLDLWTIIDRTLKITEVTQQKRQTKFDSARIRVVYIWEQKDAG